MRKIKVAQIGTSRFSHGNEILNTLQKLSDDFEIVGYALPENEKEKFPEKFAAFSTLKEMTVDEILNDPEIEAVIIETEEIYLTKYALMAAKHGKHMHMEKPGGLSLADFQELIATVKQNKTVFHTGYMYRYNPTLTDVINRAKAGEIGEIVSVEAQMSCRHGEECTRWLSTFKGGMMFFLGCHLIDLMLRLQGTPKRIIPINRSSGRFEGADSRDHAFALFEYERGASFIKTSALECGGFARRQLVITGTKGRFAVCPLEENIAYPLQATTVNECASEDWCAQGEWHRSENYHRYLDMMKSFAEMVRGEKENPYTYDYEEELFKTVLKCCE